MYLFIP
jgi:hypothetical protein